MDAQEEIDKTQEMEMDPSIFSGIIQKDVPEIKKEEKKVEAKKTYRPLSYSSSVSKYYEDKGFCQTLNQTKKNRFPKIFDYVKEVKPNAKRILSFGCATGEEVDAISDRFPNAEIVGVDLDRYSIEKARKNFGKLPNVYFTDEVGATGKYDVVLVLMVLFALAKPISEEIFEKTLKKIDNHVNRGGLLIIYTSDYQPSLVLGDKYRIIREWQREHNKNKKLYWCGYYRRKWWK